MRHISRQGRPRLPGTSLTAVLAAAGVAIVGIWTGVLAEDVPPSAVDVHGAAPARAQLVALAGLLPGGLDPTAVPHSVDPVLWVASIPRDNVPSAARSALGRKLYFDTRLSADGTVSCATCHDVTRSFTDRRNGSEGINGQVGRRNAPTTMNAMLLRTQFWDGRSPTLEHQAGQPILNAIEMGMPSREAAVAAIAGDADYQRMFEAAYGRAVNYDDIERAIASFERTQVFLDAPFDRFVAGDTDAISADARRGWELFNGKARCSGCHTLNTTFPLGTNDLFHNIGTSARSVDFEALARKALDLLAADPSEQKLDELAVGTDLSELGRFMVTRDYADLGAFKTPQLRNTGITAPYMHDGSMQTLWDVMDHYNKGGEDNPFLDGGIEALALTEQEVDQVVAFMFTLTDVRFEELAAEELAKQAERAKATRPFRDDDLAHRRVLGFERRVMGQPDGGTP